MSYCLAIDIGASSGRHLLGEIKDEKLTITEIYRFENSIKENNGTLVWDTEELVENVIRGLEECRKAEKYRRLWQLIPGVLTMFSSTKTAGKFCLVLHTEMQELQLYRRKFIR